MGNIIRQFNGNISGYQYAAVLLNREVLYAITDEDNQDKYLCRDLDVFKTLGEKISNVGCCSFKSIEINFTDCEAYELDTVLIKYVDDIKKSNVCKVCKGSGVLDVRRGFMDFRVECPCRHSVYEI